jgi:hypothetical protein
LLEVDIWCVDDLFDCTFELAEKSRKTMRTITSRGLVGLARTTVGTALEASTIHRDWEFAPFAEILNATLYGPTAVTLVDSSDDTGSVILLDDGHTAT